MKHLSVILVRVKIEGGFFIHRKLVDMYKINLCILAKK
ncbi:Uncharacterised protein [Legionella moravica]|uniref:Uncharacterized protein n=1 Tax=Legionella moravica TaxID=39962 RepID=A0A378JXF7_9GAMM|nr:Uncharacterised protein [Legionella moravica]